MKTKKEDRLTLMKIMMLLGLFICSVSEIIKEEGFSLSQGTVIYYYRDIRPTIGFTDKFFWHIELHTVCGEDGKCLECVGLGLPIRRSQLVRFATMKHSRTSRCQMYMPGEINVEGLCGSCEAHGFKLCRPMDEYQHILNCAECDDGLTLVDGECRCSTGQLLVGNLCEECPVSLNDDG
jgi:hypothetical protein